MATDTTKYKVSELKELLRRKYGVPMSELDTLVGKSNVVAKLREYEMDDEMLEQAEVIEPAVENKPVSLVQGTPQEIPGETLEAPSPFDEGWSDYILGQLRSNELSDGFPKVDGLRRLADLYRGPLIAIKSKVYESPSLNNNFTATVKVTVITSSESVDGCASASPQDLPAKYSKHPVAVAESMAEGRAYRKLLRLNNIISAEERTPSATEESVIELDGLINMTQIKTIDNICAKADINVEKWLEIHNIKLSDFDKITKTTALSLCGELNNIRQSGEVAEEIKGYNFNWRS